MWHALRTELAYFRPWIFGGLGLGAGVAALITGIFYLVGEEGPPPDVAAGLRALFMMMAPLIVGFIIQTYRSEEGRTRLLMAGPLRPRQLATITVLLPVCLFAVGVAATGLLVAGEALVTGSLQVGSLHMAAYVGSLIFMMLQSGFLIQESVVAQRERRRRAALAGWAGFVLAIILLTILGLAAFLVQGPFTWPSLHLGNLVVALAAATGAVALYAGRTDFTR